MFKAIKNASVNWRALAFELFIVFMGLLAALQVEAWPWEPPRGTAPGQLPSYVNSDNLSLRLICSESGRLVAQAVPNWNQIEGWLLEFGQLQDRLMRPANLMPN